MFMKGLFMLFLSLGLGYILCVAGKKQEGILKTLGYTLGISILVLSLVYGLLAADIKYCLTGKMGGVCGAMWKKCPMVK